MTDSEDHPISSNCRQMAERRRQVAECEKCALSGDGPVSVAVFGKLRDQPKRLLDELFGEQKWVDGGEGTGSNQTFFLHYMR